jgi:murein DD-endopeptidase MepM/ murein hydrolase activator NlpD
MRIFITFLCSALFFTIGAVLLSNIPRHTPKKTEYTYDWEEYCDEDNYLSFYESVYYPEVLLITEEKNNYTTILANQNLHEIFRPFNINHQEIAALSKTLSMHVRARDIATGDLYNFKIGRENNTNIIENFTLEKLDPNRVPITYKLTRNSTQASFDINISFPQITKQVKYIEISVKDTLFGSFSHLPFGNELMQRVMTVLSWRMRMPEHVNKNDAIKILVVHNYAHEKFIGYGDILALIYEQTHQVVKAFYFTSSDQKVAGYYDQDGNSLEKEFLASPVRTTVATSNQQLRFHPVYKTRMKHNGTDYRGSIGTDFLSIADGEVIEKRFDKNVGNMIRIRHKLGVYSEYFHADSLVENIHVGSRVKRGQKIGEIGRTGLLCTGPHLHMGIYKLAGEQRKYIELSSLRNILNNMPSLQQTYKAEFAQFTESSLAALKHGSLSDSLANKFKNSGDLSKN